MYYFANPLISLTPYLALFVRVIVGASLMIHGYPKLKSREQSVNWMKGMALPGTTAVVASILEFFGGLLLIVGLIVPILSALFIIQFLSIIVMKNVKMHADFISQTRPSYEIDVVYLVLAIVLLILGGGVLSLDKLIAI